MYIVVYDCILSHTIGCSRTFAYSRVDNLKLSCTLAYSVLNKLLLLFLHFEAHHRIAHTATHPRIWSYTYGHDRKCRQNYTIAYIYIFMTLYKYVRSVTQTWSLITTHEIYDRTRISLNILKYLSWVLLHSDVDRKILYRILWYISYMIVYCRTYRR